MKRSFADFEDKAKLACFSDKNEKSPHEIAYASGKTFIFDCDSCPHSFSLQPCRITGTKRWCKYCANQALCGDRDCQYCFEKSYEFHAGEKAKYWSDKNEKKPHEVFRTSHAKYFHHCIECDHHFLMSPIHIISNHKSWCNFCANRARCLESDDCDICFNKTFASYDPEKVACWSLSNEKGPYDFAKASHHYAYFDCDVCNTYFKKRLDKVSGREQWCPTCLIKGSSKNVEAISKKLNGMTGISYTTENIVKCDDRFLRWDFVVKHDNRVFYIENDGEQHFNLGKNMKIRRVTNFNVGKDYFRDSRVKDLLKDQHIRNSNGLLFRVTYRQRNQLHDLVNEMIEKSNAGVEGVVYMDEELYKDWGPIVDDDSH